MSRQLAFGGAGFLGNHFGAVNWNDFVLIGCVGVSNGLVGGGNVSEGDFSDFGKVVSGNSVAADAFVDNRVVVADDVVVHYGGVVEDLLGFSMVDAAAMMVVMSEVFSRDKSVMAVAQSEVEADTYTRAVIGKTGGCGVMRAGRQGRPAAVVVRIAKGDPRGRPDSSRNPNPTVAAVQTPPAVVKRRPTP